LNQIEGSGQANHCRYDKNMMTVKNAAAYRKTCSPSLVPEVNGLFIMSDFRILITAE